MSDRPAAFDTPRDFLLALAIIATFWVLVIVGAWLMIR